MKSFKWMFAVSMMFIASGIAQVYSAPPTEIKMNPLVLSDFSSIEDYQTSGLKDVEIKRGSDADSSDSFLAGVTEGNGKVTIVGRHFSEPVNLVAGDAEELYLLFNFYIEDTEALAAVGQIELTSSGTSDKEELYWSISRSGVGLERIQNGWNTVLLPFSQAGHAGGTFAKDRLNYLRIFMFSARPVKVGYGEVTVLALRASGFKEDFSDSSSRDRWTTKDASLTHMPHKLTVSPVAQDFTLRAEGYDFSLAQSGVMLLDAELTIEDKSKINELALLIGSGDDGQYARYILPLDEMSDGEAYHFITKLNDYDHKDMGLTHFYQADTVEIHGSGQPGAVLHLEQIGLSLAEDTITEMIDNIGKITVSNYLEKKKVIKRTEQLCSTFAVPTKAYISRHIPNYFKLQNDAEQIMNFEAAKQSGILVEYRLDREMIKPGQTVTALLRISNVGERSVGEIGYAFECDQRIAETKDNLTGTVTLAPGASHEVRMRLAALKGGVGSISVQVDGLDGQPLKSEKAFFIVDGRGFFFSDCHTHSIESDGKGSLADNLMANFNNGAFITYATDHNANPGDWSDLDRAIENLKSAGWTQFISLKGNEITSFVHGAGHMLHYNSRNHYAEPSSEDITANLEAYKVMIKQIIEDGDYCYIAHPFLGGKNDDGTYSGWPFVEIIDGNIDALTGYTGLEIMNSFQTPGTFKNVTLPAVKFWDRMNIKGEQKYFGISNSDAHHPPHLNATQNAFLLDGFTENRFLNALGTGRFFGTSGPELRFTLDGRDMGESVITSGNKHAVAHIEAFDAFPLSKVSLIRYAMSPSDNDEAYAAREETVLFEDRSGTSLAKSFQQDVKVTLNEQTFYRVEVSSQPSDGKVRIAYSNPIWVISPAQSLSVDQPEIEIDASGRVKLNIETDNIYDSVTLTSSDPDRLKVLDNGLVEALPGASGDFRVLINNTSGLQADCLVHVKTTVAGAATEFVAY